MIMNDKNKQMLKGALIAGIAIIGINYGKQIFVQPNADSIAKVSQVSSKNDKQTDTNSNSAKTSNASLGGLVHSIDTKTVQKHGNKLSFTANMNGKQQSIELDTDTVNFVQSNNATYQVSQDANGNSIQTVSLPISVLNKIQPAN